METPVVILTGSERRHAFFRMAVALAPGIRVLQSCCEGLENNLRSVTVKRGSRADSPELAHLDARDRSEEDFFGSFLRFAPDRSNPVFRPRGSISDPEFVEALAALQPALVIAYGCSLVREPLLSRFQGRLLNVHLGLSPYYRGAGTNFWPLVNGEPEYVGATFMYMDAGVDTGEIIHQIRGRLFPGDTPHQIGNRLIGDMTAAYIRLIGRFDRLERMPQPPAPAEERVYRKKDFSEEATCRLYQRFSQGMVVESLGNWEQRCLAVPLIENPVLADAAPDDVGAP